VKLFGDESSVHTADLTILVYPLRRRADSVGHLVTLGRAPNNDVVIADPSVSRFHAFAKQGPGGSILLQDAGSTNGTSVNGASVPAKDHGPPASLARGDTLRLGQVEFTFLDASGLRSFALEASA
jgi:pSer/pThr/pTyr-binding forkhead associated (FHA) protein